MLQIDQKDGPFFIPLLNKTEIKKNCDFRLINTLDSNELRFFILVNNVQMNICYITLMFQKNYDYTKKI